MVYRRYGRRRKRFARRRFARRRFARPYRGVRRRRRPIRGRKIYRRRNWVQQPKFRRNVGRRTFANRDLLLKSFSNYSLEFTQNDDTGTFDPLPIIENEKYEWFPDAAETNPVTEAVFNEAASKRLVSVHMYLKDLRYTEVAKQFPDDVDVTGPQGSRIYTYHNKGDWKILVPNEYIMKNGRSRKLIRNTQPYHSICKFYTYCRGGLHVPYQNVKNLSWRKALTLMNAYQQTNEVSEPVNLDWYMCPTIQTSLGSGTKGHLRFTKVITTKWRLSGIKDPYTTPGRTNDVRDQLDE